MCTPLVHCQTLEWEHLYQCNGDSSQLSRRELEILDTVNIYLSPFLELYECFNPQTNPGNTVQILRKLSWASLSDFVAKGHVI